MGAKTHSVAAAFAVRHRTHITHPCRKGALLNREPDLRFAILIDADNVSEKYVQIVLDEVANAGVATYKRIYGDWTSPRLSSWKKCLLDNSIIPMQQYSYTFGKNATDSAMIIDAMDILYSGTVDGFAIVSSDSDFTRLVARLRESGMYVIGMGEQKTPRPFISACNQFKYLDLLLAARASEEDTDEDEELEAPVKKRRARSRGRKQSRSSETRSQDADEGTAGDKVDGEVAVEVEVGLEADVDEAADMGMAQRRPRRRPGDRGVLAAPAGDMAEDADALVEVSAEYSGEAEVDAAEVEFGQMSKADRRRHMRMIRESINAIIDKFSDDDGWVSLGQLGDQLARRLPDFDVRNYGFKKLRPFLKSLGVYEFDEPSDDSGHRQIYLRVKAE